MRRMALGIMLAMLASWTSHAVAQQAPPQPEALRRQVMERFLENYRVQAGLTDEQNEHFRTIIMGSFRERREIEARQGELFRALEGQLRPGVAADRDSVVVLLDGLMQVRQAQVDVGKRDFEELSTFLDPVQQGQLLLSLERLQRQIENIIRRRAQGQ
jgi:hypothetical protein